MNLLSEIRDSLLHLIHPVICCGCGSELPGKEGQLCIRCMESLPETRFEHLGGNPVEKKFWGRLPVQVAAAHYYFSRETLIQHLVHELKYKGNRDIGLQLGKIMGDTLMKSGRFLIDALVPLPLFPAREKKRGYNQASVLCEGIAASLKVPVLKDIVLRSHHTETQTRKGRIERWQNMAGKFVLRNPDSVRNRHVLLVDDVITTGATLEACGAELLKAEGLQLSIATLCYAAH